MTKGSSNVLYFLVEVYARKLRNEPETIRQSIDNQRHGLETQAKFLMLLTPHP